MTALAQLLKVTPCDKRDTFTSEPENYGVLGIYGGHILGLALAAALETVAEPKLAHSLHAYFVNRGKPDQNLTLKVGRLRESSGSEFRSVKVIQDDDTIVTFSAAFKLPESGEQHQPIIPEVISPDEAINSREERGEPPFPFPMVQANRAQMELVKGSILPPVPNQEPKLQLWMRDSLSTVLSEREAQIVLTFLSDSTMMFNSVLPYGVPMLTHRLTSIDHSVWFHRTCDPTQWMLFDQHSSAANDGRGMNHGELYSSDGELVLTTAQESMLRRICN